MRRPDCSCDDGFTLIEALVMLVVGSLLSLVILEAVRLATHSGLRIQSASRASIAVALDEIAIRRLLGGATVEYETSSYAFEGGETMLRGYSMNSPINAFTHSEFSLSIDETETGATVLLRLDDDAPSIMAELAGGGRLRYLDGRTMQWINSWPPPASTSGETAFEARSYSRSLPAAVMIEERNGALRDAIVINMPHSASPPARADDFFGIGRSPL